MLDVSTALITFIDHKRVWFKTGTEVSEVKRTHSICQHTLGRGFLEIVDTFDGEFFRNHPAVKGSTEYAFTRPQFCLVRPVQPLGALCLVDYIPPGLSIKINEPSLKC
jgi:hypothetical protein